MQAVVVKNHGGSEVLELVKGWPVPKISRPDEVLVRVAYAGINPCDTYLRAGADFAPPLPFVIGFDGSGIVEEVGNFL